MSYDALVKAYSQQSLAELIAYTVERLSMASLLERIVARERFCRIAFFDIKTKNADRALAASWARCIEAVIAFQILEDPIRLQAYNEDRLKLLEDVGKAGYGSLVFRIVQSTDEATLNLLVEDPSEPDAQLVQSRARFLAGIVFGRAEDD